MCVCPLCSSGRFNYTSGCLRPLASSSVAADRLSPPLGIPQPSLPTLNWWSPSGTRLDRAAPFLSEFSQNIKLFPASFLTPLKSGSMQAAVPSTRLHFKVCPLYLQRIKKWVIRTSWPTEAVLIPAQAAFSDSRLSVGNERERKKVAPRRQETFSFVKASVRGPGRTSSASFSQESRPWGLGPGKILRIQSLPATGSGLTGPWGWRKPYLPGTYSPGAEEQAPFTVLS